MLGFIITRCVRNVPHDSYWIECYKHIRTFYPEHQIMIIDDNSVQELINHEELYKCTTVQAEFPGSGEFLPYYYFYKLRPFEKAVIIHDSVFIKEFIDFDNVQDVRFLWDVIHDWDNVALETAIIQKIDSTGKLLELYKQKHVWPCCYGGMSVITWDFLDKIFKYIENLGQHIKTRDDRMAFERIFACICTTEGPVDGIFGDIHRYGRFKSWKEYENHQGKFPPIVKVQSGR